MEDKIDFDKNREINRLIRTVDSSEQAKWFSSEIEKSLALPAFDDVSIGHKDWINIQPILRTAIKSLHEASTAQWQWMQLWEHRLHKKAEKDDVDLQLASKVSTSTYQAEMRCLQDALEEKADNRRLQELRQEVITQNNFYEYTKKVNRQILEIEKDISKKPNIGDIQKVTDKLSDELEKMAQASKKTSEEVRKCKDSLENLSRDVETATGRLRGSEELLGEMKNSVKQNLSCAQIEAKINAKADAVS